MTAETAKKFEALERQAQALMAVFAEAGYEAVAPALLQPAGVFLDVVGEALRARTYVFTDPDGDELCLRPDITVPACRLHLERQNGPRSIAKYCYNGAAFRFQPQGASSAHPREFRQAGIEAFGSRAREAADAETVASILAAVKGAGLRGVKLRLGDLGLLRAVLAAADMPERWRQRLMHRFWRPEDFCAELRRLAGDPAAFLKTVPEKLLAAFDPGKPADTETRIARYLEDEGVEITGARSLSEIAASLAERIADAKADPITPETAGLIERYIGLAAPAGAVPVRLEELMRAPGFDISSAISCYERRLTLLEKAGVDLSAAEFSAGFGRSLEYYTGFVFEVVAPKLGPESPVASGGRYDSLLKAAGAREDIPAVGAAIHTERLLAAVSGGKS